MVTEFKSYCSSSNENHINIVVQIKFYALIDLNVTELERKNFSDEFNYFALQFLISRSDIANIHTYI